MGLAPNKNCWVELCHDSEFGATYAWLIWCQVNSYFFGVKSKLLFVHQTLHSILPSLRNPARATYHKFIFTTPLAGQNPATFQQLFFVLLINSKLKILNFQLIKRTKNIIKHNNLFLSPTKLSLGLQYATWIKVFILRRNFFFLYIEDSY